MNKIPFELIFLLISSISCSSYTEIASRTLFQATIVSNYHPDIDQILTVDFNGRRAIHSTSGSSLSMLIYTQQAGQIYRTPEGLKGTSWFVYGYSTEIKFLTSASSTPFKSFSVSSMVISLSDLMDNQYIACVDDNKSLSIYDRSLSNLNSVYQTRVSTGTQSSKVRALSDQVRVAIGLVNIVKVYEIMDPLVATGVYDMVEEVKDFVSLSNLSFLAVISAENLVLLDWGDTTIPIVSWSKILVLQANTLDVKEGSDSIFAIGDYSSTNNGGFRIYNRISDSFIQQVDEGYEFTDSVSFSKSGEYLVASSSGGTVRYYRDSSNCHLSCGTCSTPNNDNFCTSCKGTDFLDGATTGKCQSACASGQYIDTSAEPYICKECDSDCLTCSGSGPSDCQSCESGFNLNQASGPAGCIECTSSQYLDESTTIFTCGGCDGTCLTCSGSSSAHCSSCLSPLVLESSPGSSQCLLCASSSFLDTSSNPHSCTDCHETCLTCSGANQNQCSSCDSLGNSNYLFEAGSCNFCSSSSFKVIDNSNNAICQECDDSCESCTGPNNSDCISCSAGYFESSGRCITGCSPDKSLNNEGFCESCPSECTNGCFDFTQKCIIVSNPDSNQNSTLQIRFQQASDSEGRIVLKTIMRNNGQAVSSSVNYSDESLISFLNIQKPNSSIQSTMSIDRVLGLTTVYISTSVFTSGQRFVSLEPSLVNNEYFSLEGKLMSTIFYITKIQIQNLSYEENTFGISKIGESVSSKSDGIEGFASIIGFIPFQQSTTFIRFMQTLRMYTNLRFINIDFGFKVESFMDGLSGQKTIPGSVKSLSTLKTEVIKKSSRGKLSTKKVSLSLKNLRVIQILIYFLSGIFQLLTKILIKFCSRSEYIFMVVIYFIYYSKKFHFVLMNVVLSNLTFQGLRVVLHSEFSKLDNKDQIKYWIINLGLLTMLVDIYRMMKASIDLGNIIAVYQANKQKKVIDDPFFGKITLKNNESSPNLNYNKKYGSHKVVDRYTTLRRLRINHPIRDYLVESMNCRQEDIPDQLFYTSTASFWKLLIFSISIITLQNLPVICLIILFVTELGVTITNIAAVCQHKERANFILMGFRIISNILLLPFLCYYIVINIMGYPAPSGFLASVMIIDFLAIIGFEIIYLIAVHIIIAKNLFYKIISTKSRNQEMEDKTISKAKINEFSNQIIFYKQVKSINKNQICDLNFKSQRSIMRIKSQKFKKAINYNKMNLKKGFKATLKGKTSKLSINFKKSKKIETNNFNRTKVSQFRSAKQMIVFQKKNRIRNEAEFKKDMLVNERRNFHQKHILDDF